MNGTVIVTCARSGRTKPGPVAELLDHAEDVVPAPGVEPGCVLAQLVQDLVHLERRRGSSRSAPSPGPCPAERRAPPAQHERHRSTAAPRDGSRAWAGRSTARCRASPAPRALWKKYSPKSNRLPRRGSPSTSTCARRRCQPRGRTTSVAVCSASRYSRPSVVNEIVPATASIRLTWPSITFRQVGEASPRSRP